MAQQITTTGSGNMHQKRFLKAKLAELLGASTRIEDPRGENLADPLDQINSALDREMTMNQLDARAHLVQDVRPPLDAIDDGTYGFCESCEEPIPSSAFNRGRRRGGACDVRWTKNLNARTIRQPIDNAA
jgi:RNA polymerase-binding transcription factor DksA